MTLIRVTDYSQPVILTSQLTSSWVKACVLHGTINFNTTLRMDSQQTCKKHCKVIQNKRLHYIALQTCKLHCTWSTTQC